MRCFIDLQITAPQGGLKELQEMLKTQAALGYSIITISFPQTAIKEIKKVKVLCSELGIELATRVDLKPENPKDLLQQIRQLRQKFEIVAIKCDTKGVARQAGKDRRVDILNFPTEPTKREKLHFDHFEASLASTSLSALEIKATTLFKAKKNYRAKLLAIMRKEVKVAQKSGVPIVISSGARDLYHLRTPRDLASLLTLMNVDWENALNAVSKNPLRIIERNRKKLKTNIFSQGVTLVEVDKNNLKQPY